MNLTKENLDTMLALQEAFEEKALQIVTKQYEISTGKPLRYNEVKQIEYGEQEVEVTLVTYRHCSCCPDDENTYTFPTDWLFDANWEEGYHLQIERKKEKENKRKEKERQEKEQKEKEQKEKERQEKELARERAEFERLQTKFKTKRYLIVYYNRFANETQSMKVEAENAFRAGRAFYKKHNRKAYNACIELIEEI